SLTEALPNGYRLSDGCAWARDLVDCVHEHAELHLRIELKRFRRLKEVHVMGTRAEAVRQGLIDVGEIGGPRLGIGHGEVAPVFRLPARDGIPPAIRQYVLGRLCGTASSVLRSTEPVTYADAVDVPGMSDPQTGVLLIRANPVFRACKTH